MKSMSKYLTWITNDIPCSLRSLGRSESERAFDDRRLRRARNSSVGLAYLSPQNKSLAQSFRYMRNKPTIIAFKTPSLELSESQQTTAEGNGILEASSAAEQGRLSRAESGADKQQQQQLMRLSLATEDKPLEVRTKTKTKTPKLTFKLKLQIPMLILNHCSPRITHTRARARAAESRACVVPHFCAHCPHP